MNQFELQQVNYYIVMFKIVSLLRHFDDTKFVLQHFGAGPRSLPSSLRLESLSNPRRKRSASMAFHSSASASESVMLPSSPIKRHSNDDILHRLWKRRKNPLARNSATTNVIKSMTKLVWFINYVRHKMIKRTNFREWRLSVNQGK